MDDETQALIDQLLERVVDLEYAAGWMGATGDRAFDARTRRAAEDIRSRVASQFEYERCQKPSEEKSKPSSAVRS